MEYCLPVGRQGRNKLEVTPIFPAYRQAGIIPVFQKHNFGIKALINNDIISILISNSRYYNVFIITDGLTRRL